MRRVFEDAQASGTTDSEATMRRQRAMERMKLKAEIVDLKREMRGCLRSKALTKQKLLEKMNDAPFTNRLIGDLKSPSGLLATTARFVDQVTCRVEAMATAHLCPSFRCAHAVPHQVVSAAHPQSPCV